MKHTNYYNKVKTAEKTAKKAVKKNKKLFDRVAPYILLVFFLFWTIAGVLGCVAYGRGSKNANIVSASAEVPIDTPNASIQDFDIRNYPTANYFNIDNLVLTGSTIAGITIVGKSNGITNSIVFSRGEPTVIRPAVGSTELNILCPDMVVGETYVLTFDSSRSGINYMYSGNAVLYNNIPFVLTNEIYNGSLVFYFSSSLDVEEFVISSIMINAGNVAYPYMPYYKSFYDLGYSNAYDNSMAGFFAFSTAEVTYNDAYDENDVSLGNVTVNTNITEYVNVGIDFNFFDKVARSKRISYWDGRIDILLTFSEPVPLPQINKLRGIGNSTSFLNDVIGYNSVGEVVNFEWIYDTANSFYVLSGATSILNFNVVSLQFSFGGGADGTNITVYSPDGSLYNSGYTIGFNAGVQISNELNYKQGYNEGFFDGEDSGYSKGIKDANDYTFLSLFSSVIDAPIQAFYGLFNFELLGVNLANFFSALLTIAVILAVIKLLL